MKKYIFLAITIASLLAFTTSCNQTNTENDSSKNTESEVNASASNDDSTAQQMSNESESEMEIEKSGEVINVTESNFDIVTSKGLVLIDFFATWCGPCKQQRPILEEVAKENAGKITIGALDTDKCPNLSKEYNVESIPCMILFKNGKEVKRIIGLHDKAALMSKLSEHM